MVGKYRMRKLVRWLFNRFFCNGEGIHHYTVINMFFETPEQKEKASKAINKFDAIRPAAFNQLRAELTDITGVEYNGKNWGKIEHDVK